MTTLTVTTKGQVRLRRELLRHLGVQPCPQIEVSPFPAAGSMPSSVGWRAAAAGWAGEP